MGIDLQKYVISLAVASLVISSIPSPGLTFALSDRFAATSGERFGDPQATQYPDGGATVWNTPATPFDDAWIIRVDGGGSSGGGGGGGGGGGSGGGGGGGGRADRATSPVSSARAVSVERSVQAVQAASRNFGGEVARCGNRGPAVTRCVADALDRYANALSSPDIVLPDQMASAAGPSRGVGPLAPSVQQPSTQRRASTVAPRRASSIPAAIRRAAQRVRAARSPQVAQQAVAAVALEVRKSVELIKATDEPQIADAATREAASITQALEVAEVKLEKATEL